MLDDLKKKQLRLFKNKEKCRVKRGCFGKMESRTPETGMEMDSLFKVIRTPECVHQPGRQYDNIRARVKVREISNQRKYKILILNETNLS